MSNQKNVIAKKTNIVTTSKNEDVKVKNNEIVKINLSKFTKQLESKILEKKSNERTTLYKYPIEFTKADVNNKKIGGKFRANKRNRLSTFVNNILLFTKHNRLEDLLAEIKLFDTFYKEFYLVNDYSLTSLTNVNEEKEKFADLKLALTIIQDVKNSK